MGTTPPDGAPDGIAGAGVRPEAWGVSGAYRGRGAVTLDLRVDVTGSLPWPVVSGDLYRTDNGAYLGSFVVIAPVVTDGAAQLTLTGLGVMGRGHDRDRRLIDSRLVTVRAAVDKGPTPVAHCSIFDGPNRTDCDATKTSDWFRELGLTISYLGGDISFEPRLNWDLGSLPHDPGVVPRVVSIPRIYYEAGIEVRVQPYHVIPIVQTPAFGNLDYVWGPDDCARAFQKWAPTAGATGPTPHLWLFIVGACLKSDGAVGGGTMFDRTGPLQRRACVIGQRWVMDQLRGALFPPGGWPYDPVHHSLWCHRVLMRHYVHELGHCLNMRHSSQKPKPRCGTLSVMGEPHEYNPEGPGLPSEIGRHEPAYWLGLNYGFDVPEVLHLRHAMAPDIVPGWHQWTEGADSLDELATGRPEEARGA